MAITKTIKSTKIILADECQLFQDGFKLLLEKEGKNEIYLSDVAIDGKELLEKIKMHKPHVVITVNKLFVKQLN
jgi:DNA-binding NarL/FixJ family response regulator